MKKQRKTIKSKEENKYPEINPKERGVYELLDKEFKIIIIKKLNSSRKQTMHGQNDSTNKDRKY